MSLKDTVTSYWLHLQEELLPWLNETSRGPLNEHHEQLVIVMGMARIEAFLPGWHALLRRRGGFPGVRCPNAPRWHVLSSPKPCSTSPRRGR